MNHKAFFKKYGKSRMDIAGPDKMKDRKGKISEPVMLHVHSTEIEDLYDAFKSRLLDETNLLNCTCAEEKKKVKRPGGWVCPVHGSMTAL